MDSEPLILPISAPAESNPSALKTALAALAGGQLVVMPTETVYGVAADPAIVGSMYRLYAAKGRPDDKPVALLADSPESFAEAGFTLTGRALALARRWWPGPLTLVVEGPEGYTGLRVPDHPVALALLRAVGRPLAVTSANRSGEPPARTAEAAVAELGSHVAVVLDAGRTPGGVPSTVVKVKDNQLEVLREGAIATNDLDTTENGAI